MRRWVGMTTTRPRGLRRGPRRPRPPLPRRQRTRLPTFRSRAWHGQRPAIRLPYPLSSTQRPCRRCCRSCRTGLVFLLRLSHRLRRCLDSCSSRCLVWPLLTKRASLSLAKGQAGLAEVVAVEEAVVGQTYLAALLARLALLAPASLRSRPTRWDIAPRAVSPERRRLTRTLTRRRTRTSKCPWQTLRSTVLDKSRLQRLRTARRLYRAAA